MAITDKESVLLVETIDPDKLSHDTMELLAQDAELTMFREALEKAAEQHHAAIERILSGEAHDIASGTKPSKKTTKGG